MRILGDPDGNLPSDRRTILARDERFRREQRLRSSRDFGRVRQRGQRISGPLLTLAFVRSAESGASRVGYSVSKRVGDAVTRNRVKRRLREATRRRLADLAPGWDIVITARSVAAHAEYQALNSELERMLTRSGLWRPSASRIGL